MAINVFAMKYLKEAYKSVWSIVLTLHKQEDHKL